MIRAVCFDFDGTLAHFTGDFSRLADPLRRNLGLTPEQAEALIAVRAQLQREGGLMTFGDTLEAALERLELPVPENLEALAARIVSDCSAQMALLPGAEDVLELCREHRLPLALVTNGPADMQRAAVRAVGLERHFKRVVVAGDAAVGVRKPDPRIFALACGALGCRPEETVMVGDNLEADVAGALACGMQAVYLDATPGTGYDAMPNLEALAEWLTARL